MMFKIEYGDAFFRLYAPDGTFTPATHYYCFAVIEYNQRQYACYLTGDEEEEDITAYDITDGPFVGAKPVETEVEEVEFDGENDGLREVECSKCDGDGFYFEKDPTWVAPPETIDVEPAV